MTLTRLGLLVGVVAGLVEPAEAASRAMIQARKSVFKVEVDLRSSRDPLVGQVFYREGSRAIGFEDIRESVGTATAVGGKFITNYHVVENGESIALVDPDGGRHLASVVAGDPLSDLAVLVLDEASSQRHFKHSLRFARRDAVVGESVAAIGFGAGEALAITEGLVSARYGEGRGIGGHLDRFWTDALITDGFSGGPLVNASGECVGILHAYGRPEGGLRDMGFVVPTSVVQETLAPTNRWPSLGLTLSGTSDRNGVVVAYLRSQSPAERAGIARQDLLLSVNGESLDSIGRFREILHLNSAEQLIIEGLREGEERTWKVKPLVQVTNEPNPNYEQWRGLELEVSEVPGIYVVAVAIGSVSERAGVSVDDRLMGLNGEDIEEAAALWSRLSELGEKPAFLLVQRDGRNLWLPTGAE